MVGIRMISWAGSQWKMSFFTWLAVTVWKSLGSGGRLDGEVGQRDLTVAFLMSYDRYEAGGVHFQESVTIFWKEKMPLIFDNTWQNSYFLLLKTCAPLAFVIFVFSSFSSAAISVFIGFKCTVLYTSSVYCVVFTAQSQVSSHHL